LRKQYGFTVRMAVVDANGHRQGGAGSAHHQYDDAWALLAVTDVVKEEHLIDPLKNRFGKIAEKNIAVMKRAMTETKTEV